MNQNWKIMLQSDFPFMRQNHGEEEKNIYRRYGFQCSGGWYQLLRDCCEAITARYAQDGIGPEDIDLVPAQIKEKFGTLRFYYGYEDAPCGIAAFDSLNGGVSMRFEPGNDGDDDATKKRRRDIAEIIRAAEERSRTTCEFCGAPGVLRDDREAGIFRVQTLCDACREKRIEYTKAARRKRAEPVEEIRRKLAGKAKGDCED